MYSGLAATQYDAQQKIWLGPKRKAIFGPDVTIGEAVHFMLSLNQERVIQVMDPTGEELTGAQLLRQSKIIASNLVRKGLKPGDVVGIATSNTKHLIKVLLGAYLCGTPTNTIHADFDKGTVKNIFKLTQPQIFFCDVENFHAIKDAAQELKLCGDIFVINGQLPGVSSVEELLVDDGHEIKLTSLPCANVTGKDAAVILCSSGTTGPPKAVICSHEALLNLTVMSNLSSDSVLMAFNTMYWISGLWILLASLLSANKRIITNRPFTAEYFEQLVEKHRVTDVIIASSQLAQITQSATPTTAKRLSSLRCILCGGSQVPPVLSQQMNNILGHAPRAGLTVGYGMTELSGLASENDAGPDKRKDDSVGQLMPNIEVKIVNKYTEELMGVNGEGILHIRTPYSWAGYYHDPEETKLKYVNGWLNTGDIGYFDADGFLHILGRDNDVFKSSNFMIYPAQIEELIMELAGVAEVCVFGVPDIIAGFLTSAGVVRLNNDEGHALTEANTLKTD